MRPIDADALDFSFPLTDDIVGMLKQIGIEMAKAVVDDAPTIEVERLVRCKDCDSWCEELKCGHADLGNEVAPCSEWSDQENGYARYTRPNDFCSHGERRVDDDTMRSDT